jgi:hypothetical protein
VALDPTRFVVVVLVAMASVVRRVPVVIRDAAMFADETRVVALRVLVVIFVAATSVTRRVPEVIMDAVIFAEETSVDARIVDDEILVFNR